LPCPANASSNGAMHGWRVQHCQTALARAKLHLSARIERTDAKSNIILCMLPLCKGMHPVNTDDATMVVWSMLSESVIIHRLPETVAIGRFLPVGAESLVTFLSIAHS
jgi:DTW domain-containing protein YfiP